MLQICRGVCNQRPSIRNDQRCALHAQIRLGAVWGEIHKIKYLNILVFLVRHYLYNIY